MNPRKKKIYAALIAFGFLALLVDRLILGEPSSASASPTQLAAGSGAMPAQDAGSDHKDAMTVTAQAFPLNLAPLPAGSLRDAFQLTPSALQVMSPPKTEAGADGFAAGDQQKKNSAKEFSASHKLEAVMCGEHVNVAVLDGKWVRIGDVIGGWKLTNITGRVAVFESHDKRVELTVSTTSN